MDSQASERRQHPRQTIKINQSFTVDVRTEERQHRCYFNLLELSPGGMRIRTGFEWPVEDVVKARFLLGEPLDVDIRVVWTQPEEDGRIVGLEFLKPPPREVIDRIVARYARRRTERHSVLLNQVLPIEVEREGVFKPLAGVTVQMNPEGMRYLSETPLQVGETCLAHMALEKHAPPIKVTLEVLWSKPTRVENFLVGLKFRDLSESDQTRIDQFLARRK
ncbi:MAG TPA: PilZ domain-containing protein [Candidatus Xenobia bacterium]